MLNHMDEALDQAMQSVIIGAQDEIYTVVNRAVKYVLLGLEGQDKLRETLDTHISNYLGVGKATERLSTKLLYEAAQSTQGYRSDPGR